MSRKSSPVIQPSSRATCALDFVAGKHDEVSVIKGTLGADGVHVGDGAETAGVSKGRDVDGKALSSRYIVAADLNSTGSEWVE